MTRGARIDYRKSLVLTLILPSIGAETKSAVNSSHRIRTVPLMCNLFSQTRGQHAIREFTRAVRDKTGNLPPLPGIFLDYMAPIVRNHSDGQELTMARWRNRRPIFRPAFSTYACLSLSLCTIL
jgi:hypothetical protein